jgi:hypothetical protein
MAPRPSPIRPTTPAFLLALVLIVGSAAPAVARDSATPAVGVMGGSVVRTTPRVETTGSRPVASRAAWRQSELGPSREPQVQPPAAVRPPTPNVPVARPVAVSRTTATTAEPARATTTYRGRNHVWIPSLGVSRSISFFSCSRSTYPGDRVYRWGCGGSNNVYLFGHASSVFEPLHDAYVSGRLRKGMALFYAGSDGNVHKYTVRWWKVTAPDKGAWAYASQSTPSLTLQTCVGSRSQLRLVVRLVQAD